MGTCCSGGVNTKEDQNEMAVDKDKGTFKTFVYQHHGKKTTLVEKVISSHPGFEFFLFCWSPTSPQISFSPVKA